MKVKPYGKKKKAKAIEILVDLQSEKYQTKLSATFQTKTKQDEVTKSRILPTPPTFNHHKASSGSSSTTVISPITPYSVHISIIPTTLNSFPKLPVELQEQIWHGAIEATRNRIVVWNSATVPPLLHACTKSRKLFLEENRVEYWQREILGRSYLFINWKHNIVFFPYKVPGMKRWDTSPKRVDRPIRTSDGSWVPHIRQNPQTGGGWLEEIRYMALDSVLVEDFNKSQGNFNLGPGTETNGWTRLSGLCPNLKKLLVILEGIHGREVTGNDTIDNLAKLGIIRGREMSRRSQDIKVGFEDARGRGMLLGVKICFVEVLVPYSGATYDKIVL
ncbi:uncharacterized protein PAC_07185 [Phialocephala subalpina]|uniref:2EXR domain-containing protein n=1 Tax=Phialocephala subalpina TaxID=576137 RepID=A0A1L7WWZ3_9HELO|nr:uncharacterized protein PAC_07185 [Phialocephala subalpina]